MGTASREREQGKQACPARTRWGFSCFSSSQSHRIAVLVAILLLDAVHGSSDMQETAHKIMDGIHKTRLRDLVPFVLKTDEHAATAGVQAVGALLIAIGVPLTFVVRTAI